MNPPKKKKDQKMSASRPGPTGQDFRTGFNCQTKLNRSEWGMTKMVPHIGDEVAVTISFEGIRK